MATVTLGARLRKEHAESRLNTVLILLRDILDAFVANRMQQAATEVEHVRPRQLLVPPAQTDNSQ